MEEKRVFWAI